MDNAGSGIHGDVVGQHAENPAIEKWMLEVEALHFSAGKVGEFANVSETALLGHIFRQLRRDDINFAAGFEGHVLFIRMESHRHRRGQRPRSCRPDDGRGFLSRKRRIY